MKKTIHKCLQMINFICMKCAEWEICIYEGD